MCLLDFQKAVNHSAYISKECEGFIVPDDPDDEDQKYATDEEEMATELRWKDVSALA